jgi:hypothetical protein
MQVPFMGGLTMYIRELDQQCTVINLVATKEIPLGEMNELIQINGEYKIQK